LLFVRFQLRQYVSTNCCENQAKTNLNNKAPLSKRGFVFSFLPSLIFSRQFDFAQKQATPIGHTPGEDRSSADLISLPLSREITNPANGVGKIDKTIQTPACRFPSHQLPLCVKDAVLL